jgi:hypothetical protein
MHHHSELLKRTCLGAAGGFLGTVAVQALMAAGKKWAPQTLPPVRQEPGEFMVDQAEKVLPPVARDHVPKPVENAAAAGLGVGYGVAFGALYGALRPRGGNAFVDGALLGLGCWAAGYLGWLPALGLMPPINRQTAPEVAGPVVDHLAYGMVTVAAFDWLRDHFNPAVPLEEEFGAGEITMPVGAGI